MANRLGYLLAALIIIALGALAAFTFWRVFRDMNGQLAVALITFVGTVSIAVWNFQRTKEKEAEARLFPQRAAIYEEILNVLKDLTSPEETKRSKPEEHEIIRRLLDAKFKLIVWGSSNSLKAIDYISEPNYHDGDMFSKVAYLMGSMRRDLGHKVNSDECIFMALYIIKFEDQPKVRSLMIESDFYKNRLSKDFGA